MEKKLRVYIAVVEGYNSEIRLSYRNSRQLYQRIVSEFPHDFKVKELYVEVEKGNRNRAYRRKMHPNGAYWYVGN